MNNQRTTIPCKIRCYARSFTAQDVFQSIPGSDDILSRISIKKKTGEGTKICVCVVGGLLVDLAKTGVPLPVYYQQELSMGSAQW